LDAIGGKLVPQQKQPSSRAPVELSAGRTAALRRGSEDESDDNSAISSSSVSTVTATTSSISSDGTMISTVSSQTTKAVTTDYSSPKLGGRSLGAKKKYAPSGRTNKADADDEERPRSDSDKENNTGGGGGGVGGGSGAGGMNNHTTGNAAVVSLGLHKKEGATEEQQEEHVQLAKAGLTPQLKARFKTGDLLAHTPAYKIATANQVMPDAVGSPAQIRSHISLLNLAKDVAENRVESPKPAYLRRLDSPQTHSGKLIQKKTTLETWIRRAISNVPNMDMTDFASIKANILEAVLLLEASTAADTSGGHQ